MLISDPAADQAAACMSVGVGHTCDPRDMAGIAHAVEHTLFISSLKYADRGENYFKRLLKAHAGATNASTSAEATTYHFSVHHKALEEALDVWSCFFTCPTFDAGCIDREMNAVDAENAKNLNDDGRRLYQLKKALAEPGHPFSKFGTGDLSTLKLRPEAAGVDIRAAFVAHYERFYSARIMTLAVLGRQSLDELEALVTGRGAGGFGTDFAAVRTTPEDAPPATDAVLAGAGHPYPAARLRKIAFLEPVREMRSLRLRWPIADQPRANYARAGDYVSHALGHEGAGSVLAALKALGWAEGLSAFSDEHAAFACFEVSLALTPAGVAHAAEVVAMIYHYLARLRGMSDEQMATFHAEMSQVAANAVRFKVKTEPTSAVTGVAGALQDFPAADCLAGPALIAEFAPDAARAVLATLHPDNALCIIMHKDASASASAPAPSSAAASPAAALQPLTEASYAAAGALTETKEPAYGFAYKVAPVSNTHLAAWGASASAAPSADASGAAAGDHCDAAWASFKARLEASESGRAMLSQAAANRWTIGPLRLPDTEAWLVRIAHLAAAEEAAAAAASAAASPAAAATAPAAVTVTPPVLQLHLPRPNEFIARDFRVHTSAPWTQAIGDAPLGRYGIDIAGCCGDSSSGAGVAGGSGASLTPRLQRAIAAAESAPLFGDADLAATPRASDAPAAAAPSPAPADSELALPPHPLDAPLPDEALFAAALGKRCCSAGSTAGAVASPDGSDASATATDPTTAALSQSALRQPLTFAPKFRLPAFIPLAAVAEREAELQRAAAAAQPAGVGAGTVPSAPPRRLNLQLTPPAAAAAKADAATSPSAAAQDRRVVVAPPGVWLQQQSAGFRFPRSRLVLEYALPDALDLTGPPFAPAHAVALAGDMAHDLLNEAITYDAALAGLSGDIDVAESRGVLRVSVSGYSEKLPVLAAALRRFARMGFLSTPAATLQRAFERCKDASIRRLVNASKEQPLSRSASVVQHLLLSRHRMPDERLPVVKALQLSDVLSVWRAATATGAGVAGATSPAPLPLVRAMTYGNISTASALEAVAHAADAAEVGDCDAAAGGVATAVDAPQMPVPVPVPAEVSTAPPSAAASVAASAGALNLAASAVESAPGLYADQLRGPIRVALLAGGTDVTVTTRHPNPQEPNCAVEVWYQIGPPTSRTSALALLLAQLMAEPAFTQLRTTEQLGYMVSAGLTSVGGTCLCLVVRVQSANASVAHVERRILDFVERAFMGVPPAPSSSHATTPDVSAGAETAAASTTAVAAAAAAAPEKSDAVPAAAGILPSLTDEKVASVASVLAYRTLEPDKTPGAEWSRSYSAVFGTDSFDFRVAEATAAALQAAKKEDVLAFAQAVLLPGSPHLRRIISRVVSPMPEEQPAAPASVAVSSGAGTAGGSAAGPATPALAPSAASAAPTPVAHDGGPRRWPGEDMMTRELKLSRREFIPRVARVDWTGSDSGAGYGASAGAGGSGSCGEPPLAVWLPTLDELVELERRHAAALGVQAGAALGATTTAAPGTGAVSATAAVAGAVAAAAPAALPVGGPAAVVK